MGLLRAPTNQVGAAAGGKVLKVQQGGRRAWVGALALKWPLDMTLLSSLSTASLLHSHAPNVPLSVLPIVPLRVLLGTTSLILPPHLPWQLSVVLAKIDTWQFDSFELNEVSGGRPLSTLTFAIMSKLGLVPGRNDVCEVRLARFLCLVEEGYPDNLYHSRCARILTIEFDTR